MLRPKGVITLELKQAADTAGNVSLLGLQAGGRRYMSKPRGQKTPRRSLVSAVINSRPPDSGAKVWSAIADDGGALKAAAFATLIILNIATTAIDAAHAQAQCPVRATEALDEAQKILQGDDQTKLDAALACITLALAQTQAELADLREGRAAFTGQIYAPRGIVMSKPSVQEGR